MKKEYRVYSRESDREFWCLYKTYKTRFFALKCVDFLRSRGLQVTYCVFAA